MEPDEFGGGGVGRGGVLIEHQDEASPSVQMQGQEGLRSSGLTRQRKSSGRRVERSVADLAWQELVESARKVAGFTLTLYTVFDARQPPSQL